MMVSAAPYELVIGIECHVELATRSKMFCSCAARWFGAPPNAILCPVCLGLPGALPVPNRRALWLEIPSDSGGTKRVGIRRAHLEEDTGRSFHADGATLIDFNRSGVPLLEIVSEPDLSSVGESLAYLEALREHVVTAGVSEFRLEEGAGRFDVNVSIRFTEDGQVRWPPQSEIKNLNSFRALEDAVPYEAARLWDDWQ